MKLEYNFYCRTMVDILLKNGVSLDKILYTLNTPANKTDILNLDLTVERIHTLTLFFKKQMQTSYSGLTIAKSINYYKTDFFGSYAYSSRTLGEAITGVHKVYKKVNPFVVCEILKKSVSQFTYYIDKFWEIKHPESAKELIDFAMVNGLLSAKALTGQNIIPLSVEFKYDRPEYFRLYETIFQCPISFGQSLNRIRYPLSIMELTIPTYNPFLLNILDDFAQKLVEENEFERNLNAKVKSIIINTEKFRMLKEEDVAQKLGIGKRTLQKKLNDEHTSFQKIRETVHKDLSLTYLKSDNISIKEIAWSLGYKEISSFYRAFKRWTGLTPKQYRLNNLE